MNVNLRPGAEGAPSRKVAVSVVVPLLRDRDVKHTGLVAWTRQVLPIGEFEVVAVSSGDGENEAASRAILRPGDRLVVAPDITEPGLWDAGARAALGDIVVLTEGHCVPEAGCLAAAVAAIDGGLDVGCFESRTPTRTAAGWLENAIFQDLFERLVDRGDPRAMSLRGVAISRAIYERSGGLRVSDNECFAERVLAARLATAGARFGRAPGARVEHTQNSTFRAVRADVLEFQRSDVETRLAGTGDGIDPQSQLERSAVWERRARFNPAFNRAALPGLGMLALGPGRAARSALRATPGTAVRALTGPRLAVRGAALHSHLATAAVDVQWRFGRRPDPRALWRTLAGALALRALDEQVHDALWPTALTLARPGDHLSADALAEHAIGLHDAEEHEAFEFRWSEPVVTFDLLVGAGVSRVIVDTLAFRALKDGHVRAAWGGRRLPRSAVRVSPTSIAIDLPNSTNGPLTLALPRLHAPRDRRALGIAIVSVSAG